MNRYGYYLAGSNKGDVFLYTLFYNNLLNYILNYILREVSWPTGKYNHITGDCIISPYLYKGVH